MPLLPEVDMTRASLFGLGLLLASASEASAQASHVGRFELSGRYQPTLRKTTVVLDVTKDAAGRYGVTRTARVSQKTIAWTSARATVSGQTLTVRYEVGGGLSGNVPGGDPPHVFTATYVDGLRLSERVRNVTKKAPEAWWASLSSSGGRAVE